MAFHRHPTVGSSSFHIQRIRADHEEKQSMIVGSWETMRVLNRSLLFAAGALNSGTLKSIYRRITVLRTMGQICYVNLAEKQMQHASRKH